MTLPQGAAGKFGGYVQKDTPGKPWYIPELENRKQDVRYALDVYRKTDKDVTP